MFCRNAAATFEPARLNYFSAQTSTTGALFIPMLSVSSRYDDHTQLDFLVDGCQIIVNAEYNLIDNVFPKLQSLYFKDSESVSVQYCIGLILGSVESKGSCIGAILPLSAVEELFQQILEARMIWEFLNVCKCIVPGLTVTVDKRSKTQDSNVQLPTSSIWALLALAEVLGAADVHSECCTKLQRMAKHQPDGTVLLPQSATSIFSACDTKTLLSNLADHLRRYGDVQALPAVPTSRNAYEHYAAPSTEEKSCYSAGSHGQDSYGDNGSRHSSGAGGSVRSAGMGSVSSGVRSVLTDAGYDSETLGTTEEGDELPAPPPSSRARWPPSARTNTSTDALNVTASVFNSSGRAASPAPFGSVTPRFHTPFAASAAAPRPPTTPTPRFERAVKAPSSGSPNTDFEYDSDSPRVNRAGNRDKEASATKPALTAEDLKISREIAKLRLQEAKVKEELEASKLRAEREMREARLKSLELKAAVARTAAKSPLRRSGGLTSAEVTAANTRRNASVAASVDRTPGGAERRSGSAPRGTQQASGHARTVAEEARLRAAQRIREAKQAQERREEQELIARRAKEEQKWSARDKKIAQFIEKQNGQQGSVQDPRASADGVSARWLRGTSSEGPVAVVKSPGGVKVATEHRAVPKYRYGEPSPVLDDDAAAELEAMEDLSYTAEQLRAVGLGYSPGTKLPHRGGVAQRVPASPASPASARTAADLVSVRILRAWGLPDALGGTNAYVVVDWGAYGKSPTQAVPNSTEPHFGALLQFRSPYMRLSMEELASAQSDPAINILRGEEGALFVSWAAPMKVSVYNRNQSVSDEVIGGGKIDVHECISRKAGEPTVLHLQDQEGNAAGCLEFAVFYTPA